MENSKIHILLGKQINKHFKDLIEKRDINPDLLLSTGCYNMLARELTLLNVGIKWNYSEEEAERELSGLELVGYCEIDADE